MIVTKNCDSVPTADRVSKTGKIGGKANLCIPKGGSNDLYVVEEVNPIDKTRKSEEGARFANTQNLAAAQLVFEGAVPKF